MSQIININESPVFNPASYDSGTFTTNNSYPTSNGLANTSSTSYARFTVTTTAQYCIYSFNVTGIPSNATINSVTCSVKAYATNTNVTTRNVQLYSGTTAMGEAYQLPTSNTTNNITNPGTWTLAQLQNAKLRFDAVRTGTSSTYYIRFYGANLTVNYTVQGTQYDITSTLSTDSVDSISPAGLTQLIGGNDYELIINAADIDDFMVEDNGVDVTDSLVLTYPTPETITATIDASTYDENASSYNTSYNNTSDSAVDGVYSGNVPTNGATGSSSSTRACVFSNTGSGVTSYLVYGFNTTNIPSNAIITSVTCTVKASYYNSNSMLTGHVAQLYSGTTAKGSSTSITGTGSTSSTQTVNGGNSWTREELNNINIRYTVTRGTSNTTSAASFSFWGATLSVSYTLPTDGYYVYTLTNVNADHTIIISDPIIEIPEEDPQYNYYPITISSINATTTPGRGTTRVVEGTNQTITIYPSDPLVTLITDNGVDVSSQLVQHSNGTASYNVATASGASYGFTLNSSTGYYVSQNAGVASSAAVCRVSLSLPVRCLITISYINYAEATYDYGIFGNIDTALGTTSTADSNVKLACNTNAQNTSSVQTLTYEIESGSHFIDIKFRKDTSADSNNDNLQFKIDSITELEPNNYYTYTLSNINQAHSLIFVFGNVSYYFANSSSSGCRLYPAGQTVLLAGDTYKLVIVPDDYSYDVSVTDNNTNVTGNVQRIEQEITKNGETVTIVNYEYTLTNVNATHTIEVVCTPNESLYVKLNGSWVQVTKIYRKVNNVWTEVTLDSLTEPNIYIMK